MENRGDPERTCVRHENPGVSVRDSSKKSVVRCCCYSPCAEADFMSFHLGSSLDFHFTHLFT